MKKVWPLIFLLGCKSTQTLPDNASPLIFIWTNAQQKEIDSLNKRITELEKMVVILPPGSVVTNPDGSQRLSKIMRINTIITEDTLRVILEKKDTSNPHNGNDTLIHAPN